GGSGADGYEMCAVGIEGGLPAVPVVGIGDDTGQARVEGDRDDLAWEALWARCGSEPPCRVQGKSLARSIRWIRRKQASAAVGAQHKCLGVISEEHCRCRGLGVERADRMKCQD